MNEETVLLDPDLVAMLGNPLEDDRPPLVQQGAFLVCIKTGVGFPIINGIPHLLPEDVISAEDLKQRLG
jgi:uncharacterized protein YbaR (Trm112 family)